ncbi:P-loop NTPase fold protein [Malaciobacter sp. WC5094]
MLNSNEVESKLKELLLEENKNYVIQLYGKWGVGKTYLWNDVINGIEDKKKVVKVTLFEKNSIEELKEDIVLQTYAINKHLEKYSGAFDSAQTAISKIMGGTLDIVPKVSTLLSFLKQSDFEDIIISFDDIERRNKNFSFDSFLGYVSLLKEEKKCNVVLILNYDKLSKADKKIFDRYKEKLIDFNLILNREPNEAMEYAVKDIETNFNKELEFMVNSLNISNIRIIKHMVKMLIEIERVNLKEYSQYIVNPFIKMYLFFAYIYYSFGVDNIKSLLAYQTKLREYEIDKETKVEKNESFDKALNEKSLVEYFYKFNNEIFEVLNDVMKSHFLSESNKLKIEKKLESLSAEEELAKSIDKIQRLSISYRLDLFNTIDSYYDDIYKELRKYKNDIVRKMEVKNFFFYIDIISKKNPKEVKALEEQCVEPFLKWIIEYEKTNYSLPTDFYMKSPIKYLEERNQKYIKKLNKLRKKEISNFDNEKITEIIDKINNNKCYLTDIGILNSLKKKNIKNYIKEDINHSERVLFFVREHKSNERFKPFCSNVIEVIKTIYDEGNVEINTKIEKLYNRREYNEIMSIINPN